MAFKGLSESHHLDSKEAKEGQKTAKNRGILAKLGILNPSKEKVSPLTRVQKAHDALHPVFDFENRSRLPLAKKMLGVAYGALLATQNYPEEVQQQIFTVLQNGIKKIDASSDLGNNPRALLKYIKEQFNQDLRNILDIVAVARKATSPLTDETYKAIEKELLALSQAHIEARLEIHKQQLDKIQNPYLVQLLKSPERTGQYLTATNAAFERLNSIIWMGVDDEINVFTAEEERELLKATLREMGITLNEVELTAVQEENSHLRMIYNELKDKHKNLTTNVLHEMYAYKIKAEKYKKLVFNGLAPGNRDVCDAYGSVQSRVTAIGLKTLCVNEPNGPYKQSLEALLDELVKNTKAFFRSAVPDMDLNLITKKSDEEKRKIKNMDKELKAKDLRLGGYLLGSMADPEIIGKIFAEHGHLASPQSIDLLRKRIGILETCLRSVKNGETANLFKNQVKKEIKDINILILKLEAAIVKKEAINKKVANLIILEAELYVKLVPLVGKNKDFITCLQEINENFAELEKLYKQSKSTFASLQVMSERVRNISSALDKLRELASIPEQIKSLENNLKELEELDPGNDQLVHFKALLKQLKAPLDLNNSMWQHVGSSAVHFQELNTSFITFKNGFDLEKSEARNKLYAATNYQPQNIFVPPEIMEQKPANSEPVAVVKSKRKESAREKLEREAKEAQVNRENNKRVKEEKRRNGVAFVLELNKFEARIEAFRAEMHACLTDSDLELKRDHNAPDVYLDMQKLVAKRAQITIKTDRGVRLTPAQAIAELAATAQLITKQITKSPWLMLETVRSLEKLTNQINHKRNSLIEDLEALDVLRLRYKKLYLKSALINPVLIDLVDKYPNIFSDDLTIQQRQVEIFNRGVIEGLSFEELDYLTEENLQIGITAEDMERVDQFNRLPAIFDLTKQAQLQQLLKANKLDVSADALNKFLAFDRNTPGMRGKLKDRAEILKAKEQLAAIQQRFSATRKNYETSYKDEEALTHYESCLDQMQHGSPADAKQLGEMVDLIKSITEFDYKDSLGKLRKIRPMFAYAQHQDKALLAVDTLSEEIRIAECWTSALVLHANRLADKLDAYKSEQGRIAVAEKRLAVLPTEGTHAVRFHHRRSPAQMLGESMFGRPQRSHVQRGVTQKSAVEARISEVPLHEANGSAYRCG